MRIHCSNQDIARFWSRVDKTIGRCWFWTGQTVGWGYGRIHLCRNPVRMVLAHRLSWQLAYGDIPDGRLVLHRCDMPACVNPRHLFLGSAADNAHDRDAKGRGNGPRGEEVQTAVLTVEKVREIRLRYSAGNVSQRALANEFGVSQPMIGQIVRRESWKHI